MRTKTRSQRAYVYFAIGMAVIMIASAVFPVLLQGSQQPILQEQIPPTAIPAPTLPPAVTDFSAISFDETYLHPSGLFTVGVPTGWVVSSPSNNGTQVQVNMRNQDILSVIESYVDIPAVEIESLDDLNAYFDSTMLGSGWRSYTEWRETGRRVDTEANQVQIDFELAQGRQSYIARHVAWLDGDWIKVVRVVTTPNMSDLLRHLVGGLPETLHANQLFADTPAVWTAFYNPVGGEIIRYPNGWIQEDGRPGFPVSIAGTNGERLRLEVPVETTIADESAAVAYVESLRPGVTVASVEAIERNGAAGYAVSYNSSTLDGEGTSGAVLLLNGADGLLHAATLVIPVAGADLNAVAEDAAFSVQDAGKILSSFNLTDGLAVPAPEVEEEAPAATEEAAS